MNQQYQIGLVVFDWAGTTVDYGSSAPSEVFDTPEAWYCPAFSKYPVLV